MANTLQSENPSHRPRRRRPAAWAAAGVIGLGASLVPAPASADSPSPMACDANVLQGLVPQDVRATITAATTSSSPEVCRVEGVIVPGAPVSAVPIRFQVSMPKSFNGRFLLEAQGGSGGGAVPNPTPSRLSAGYVVASSDRGNAPLGGLDFSWQNDDGQNANWAYRATHLTAVVGEAVSRGYYDVDSLNRYLIGCSAGGHAGWSAARNTATEDFDGIVLGASGAVGSAQIFSWARIMQHISLHPDGWIPPDLLQRASDAIIGTYDGVDGVTDGIIQDDRLFVLDENLLRNVGFSQAQLETFNLIRGSYEYYGSDVPYVVRGFTISRVSEWAQWLAGTKPPAWSLQQPAGVPLGFLVVESSYRSLVGPDFNFVTDLDINDPAQHKFLTNPYDRSGERPFDLSEFRDAGGKLLMYFGQDDPAISPRDGIVARDEMLALEPEPSAENLADWARMYLVPGIGHCGGGPGPADTQDRLLSAMTGWVEHGEAPSALTATSADGKRDFLLCQEPQIARFSGFGDVNDASNWACGERPEPLTLSQSVQPRQPTFRDLPRNVRDIVVIPADQHVDFYVDGTLARPGATKVEPGAEVTVTALAKPGYWLGTGVESTWTYQFTSGR